MAFPRMDFRAPRTAAAGAHRPHPSRTTAAREMVSGLVSWCLHQAVKDHAGKQKTAVYRVYADMGLGNSTVERMTECRPIAQTTALKVLKYLGTDVRSVLSKYQQKVTK
jgi:hypothetical protein